MILALPLAACGGDGVLVEGTFAGGWAPTAVWVVESERRESADSAGFRVADLTPGPASLRLLQGGDTAGVLDLSGLGGGARVRLEGLRVDPATGFAFPRAVHLEGPSVVTVNGLRMAPAGRVPRRPDVRGEVLAWSPEAGAMLLRPDHPRLPDLRVVVGLATEVLGEDGGGADAALLRPGDSVRVEGRSDQGYVVASRITVPTRIAGSGGEGAPDGGDAGDGQRGDGDGGGAEGDGGGAVSRIPQGGSATPAPPLVDERSRGRDESRGRDDARGRDDSRGRDEGRGRGRGRGEEKGKGKGKKG